MSFFQIKTACFLTQKEKGNQLIIQLQENIFLMPRSYEKQMLETKLARLSASENESLFVSSVFLALKLNLPVKLKPNKYTLHSGRS